MDDGKPGGSITEKGKLWLQAAALPPKDASWMSKERNSSLPEYTVFLEVWWFVPLLRTMRVLASPTSRSTRLPADDPSALSWVQERICCDGIVGIKCVQCGRAVWVSAWRSCLFASSNHFRMCLCAYLYVCMHVFMCKNRSYLLFSGKTYCCST